jgi:hypothetical protein
MCAEESLYIPGGKLDLNLGLIAAQSIRLSSSLLPAVSKSEIWRELTDAL